jgi:two-component system sensor histidine kinase/response regulator
VAQQRILIVDDEPAIRRLVQGVLGNAHMVLEAASVVEARPLVEDGVDLVLLDMVGTGGVGAMTELRSCARGDLHLPILMLTGLSDVAVRLEGLASGADDFITKPFHPDELRRRVAVFLSARAQDQVLRQQRDDLQWRLLVRDELLALLAHDLRNPLTSVFAAFELLKREAISEVGTRDIADGLAAAQRIKGVTEDFLDLLADETVCSARRRTTRLRELADRAAAGLASVARSHDVRVVIHGDAEVDVDPALVLRAIENLVFNAIRHTPAQTNVVIRVNEDADAVVLSVEDRGPGVAEKQKAGLFRKNSYGASAGHVSYGLGLYVVDLVARAHGGSVGFAPREGGGSNFFVRLQRKAA